MSLYIFCKLHYLNNGHTFLDYFLKNAIYG